jgi:NDP-sugar pyrophosphorylase family protein
MPYTAGIPKPLVAVGDYPIAEIVVRQLKKNGFTNIFFAVNHLSHLIEDYFGTGERFGMEFSYYRELKPLSTMGPLHLMQSDLPENFLVMNGDVLTDLNFAELLETHTKSGAVFTIASKERVHNVDYGVLHVDETNALCGFQEKPDIAYLVSMGVYAATKAVLAEIPADTFFGFDHLMAALLQGKKRVNVFRYNGYWNDIGRPDDYLSALNDIDKLKDTFEM